MDAANTETDDTSPLHVGLNAGLLTLDETFRGAGINWYIQNLLAHLPQAAPDIQFTAFVSDRRFSPSQGLRVSRPMWNTSRPLKRILWEQLAAPAVQRRQRIALWHSMAFVSPLMSQIPAIVTVFDLSFLLFPQIFKPAQRLYLQEMTGWSVRRAAQVIAISEHTRQDVIARLGAPAERVQTVYCGVDPSFAPLPADEIEVFRRQKGLPERFILFLSTIEPRKNVLRLLDAFYSLVNSGRPELADLHLVLAGGKGWFFEPMFAHARALGLEERVHWPGYVPEAEKKLWYNAAMCFCYPSLYEGFGLPPLEAMACGTPVVTSNAASLPEVVGDAGLMVQAEDVAGLKTALERLLDDVALRRELSGRGTRRAARFTWEAAARQTAQIYRQACPAPAR